MTDTPFDAAAHPRQGKAWSAGEDRQLYDSFVDGQPINGLAAVHGRSAGGIRSRLGRLGLIDQNGDVVEPAPPFATVGRAPPTSSADPVTTSEQDAVRSVFAIRTSDGWVVEIKSNQPLSRPMVERLTSMLQGVLPEDDKGES